MWYTILAASFFVVTGEAFSPQLYHSQWLYLRETLPLFAAKATVATGITLKLAVDSQGGVAELANVRKSSERFTSPASLDMVHRLRRDSHGVLIGKATVLADDPSLTIRRVVANTQPVRIVLDTHLSILTRNFTIFNDGLKTLVYHADNLDDLLVNDYATEQTVCVGVPIVDGLLSVRAVVQDLRSQQNLQHVMVEGGAAVARSFLQHKLVDRLILVQAINVTFHDPYPSGLTEELLAQQGLECLGLVESGDGDIWQFWSRVNLPWPTEKLENWP